MGTKSDVQFFYHLENVQNLYNLLHKETINQPAVKRIN